MDKWSNRIRLLFLLTILFVWFFIRGILENDALMTLFWGIFTLVYVVSITIFYFLNKKYQE